MTQTAINPKELTTREAVLAAVADIVAGRANVNGYGSGAQRAVLDLVAKMEPHGARLGARTEPATGQVSTASARSLVKAGILVEREANGVKYVVLAVPESRTATKRRSVSLPASLRQAEKVNKAEKAAKDQARKDHQVSKDGVLKCLPTNGTAATVPADGKCPFCHVWLPADVTDLPARPPALVRKGTRHSVSKDGFLKCSATNGTTSGYEGGPCPFCGNKVERNLGAKGVKKPTVNKADKARGEAAMKVVAAHKATLTKVEQEVLAIVDAKRAAELSDRNDLGAGLVASAAAQRLVERGVLVAFTGDGASLGTMVTRPQADDASQPTRPTTAARRPVVKEQETGKLYRIRANGTRRRIPLLTGQDLAQAQEIRKLREKYTVRQIADKLHMSVSSVRRALESLTYTQQAAQVDSAATS